MSAFSTTRERAARPEGNWKAAGEPCRHCGLPLGRSRFGENGEFCCRGCQSVNALLVSQGLERYYELRGASEAPAPELTPGSFAWFDTLAPDRGGAGLARLTLDVQGIHCAACVWLLEELWRREKGGVDLCINPSLGRAEIVWREEELDLRRYLALVERFGYRFGPARKLEPRAPRGLVLRLGISAAAAANVMIFSLCYYAGLGAEEPALHRLFGALSFALATVAVLAGGTLFIASAWRGLVRGVPHLDLPIALGIVLAWGGSTWAWIARGPEAAYFDTVAIFVTLMVLGRLLQERVLEKNRLGLLASEGVDDLFTRRRSGTTLETIPVARVRTGDELWILPGDVVPVGGTLLGEPAALSLDWIDGESRPRTYEPGDAVPAGAFPTGGVPVRIAATEQFAASRLSGLFATRARAEERSQRNGRGDPWSARVARGYVAGVLLLSGAAFAIWWSHGAERALEVALAVLVITCPCAIGLATPLAHELVHVALRRRGVFLRDASVLARVLRVRHVLFDKTGTLTRGVLAPSQRSLAALRALDGETLAVLRDATAKSLHPVSRALSAALSSGGPVPLAEGVTTREVAGFGLEIRRGQGSWRLGRAEYALGRSVGPDEDCGTLLTRDGNVLARFEFEEELKGDAPSEVRALEEAGFAIHVLSGDRAPRVERVAAALGLAPERVHAELSPEGKVRILQAIDREDTFMVGDGINDGPAFDAAYCAATPAVDRPSLPARSDLYFLGDGISAVRRTLQAARVLSSVLRTNLVLATLYNLCAVLACVMGQVGPLAAAVLMPASSLFFLALTSARLSERRLGWTS